MAVRIGHASKDENGRAVGGSSGDQTGKELCIRNWYNGGWGFLARPKRREAAERIAANCESGCNNENLGYGQDGRNTGLQEAKKVNWDLSRILTPSEFDCSSFVSCCVQASGIQIWSGGNAPTTRTLRQALEATGEFEILTDAKYLTSSDYLLRGDTLCKPGSHTVIVLDDGPKAEATEPAQKPQGVTYNVQLPLLKKGSTGASVEALQMLLFGHGGRPSYLLAESGGVDGEYGPGTEAAVKKYQQNNGLTVDGEVGGQTWGKLLGV